MGRVQSVIRKNRSFLVKSERTLVKNVNIEEWQGSLEEGKEKYGI